MMANPAFRFLWLSIFSVVIIGFSSLGSCKKKDKYGKFNHSVIYTTSKNAFRVSGGPDDSLYSEFGTYITSITPKKFTAKLNIMNLMDHWDLNDQKTHMIGYLNTNTKDGEISQFADFSGNRVVNFKPILGGTDIIYTDAEQTNAIFRQSSLTFKYFTMVYYYFYQEMDLPTQYKDLKLDQFNQYYNEWIKPNYGGTNYNDDTMKTGTFLKSRSAPFTANTEYTSNVIIFGNTDSTFIFNKNKNEISASENYTLGGTANWPVIRSHKFAPVTVTRPNEGQVFELKSTVVFDTERLIQIYAGKDNIPYTKDDVFIYAPKFWERMKVRLEVIQ
ncbi:MAG: hypothetical protein JNL57_11620 [Bacteroidetes bacterium]|nr:hypothetical protein [Bacteroidota bacterium]